jgi:hypothetical protein
MRVYKKQRGFIALFFVLTISSLLTMLVLGLSRSFSYTLTLLDNFKGANSARSAALYCKYKLFNNTLYNMEYVPVLGADINAPYDSVCRYESYRKTSVQTSEVIIVGKTKSNIHFHDTFTIKYTYTIDGDLHNYLKNIQTVPIL